MGQRKGHHNFGDHSFLGWERRKEEKKKELTLDPSHLNWLHSMFGIPKMDREFKGTLSATARPLKRKAQRKEETDDDEDDDEYDEDEDEDDEDEEDEDEDEDDDKSVSISEEDDDSRKALSYSQLDPMLIGVVPVVNTNVYEIDRTRPFVTHTLKKNVPCP